MANQNQNSYLKVKQRMKMFGGHRNHSGWFVVYAEQAAARAVVAAAAAVFQLMSLLWERAQAHEKRNYDINAIR